MTGKKEIRVGLQWHSLREGNLGVGAFTLSHIYMLDAAAKAANRKLSVCIYDPIGGPHWHPPRDIAVTELVYDLTKDVLPDTPLWRSVAECDVILDIGAGELTSDVYGGDLSFAVVCSRLAALVQHKRLILSPQTIGPFNSPYLQMLTEQLIRRCERTFTRDVESLQFLKGIGVHEGVEDCADLAFRLPFESQPKVSGQPLQFGLNVSGLLYLEASLNRFSFGLKVDYPALIDRLIGRLKQRSDVQITLVPHCVAEGSDNRHADDVWICRELSERHQLPMAPRFKSPIEAKSFISGLDVLAGSRLHATIAAVSSGVPAIPLGHTRKFTGVFGAVSFPLVCDLRSNDEQGVLACVDDSIGRLPELREAAVRSARIAQSKLDNYQTFLNELMLSLP